MQLRSIAGCALVALSLASCGGGNQPQAAASPTPSATDPGSSGVALQAAFTRVVRDVSPSVVQIQTSEGLGSGIVFDDRRDIVTNAHVVAGEVAVRSAGEPRAARHAANEAAPTRAAPG